MKSRWFIIISFLVGITLWVFSSFPDEVANFVVKLVSVGRGTAAEYSGKQLLFVKEICAGFSLIALVLSIRGYVGRAIEEMRKKTASDISAYIAGDKVESIFRFSIASTLKNTPFENELKQISNKIIGLSPQNDIVFLLSQSDTGTLLDSLREKSKSVDWTTYVPFETIINGLAEEHQASDSYDYICRLAQTGRNIRQLIFISKDPQSSLYWEDYKKKRAKKIYLRLYLLARYNLVTKQEFNQIWSDLKEKAKNEQAKAGDEGKSNNRASSGVLTAELQMLISRRDSDNKQLKWAYIDHCVQPLTRDSRMLYPDFAIFDNMIAVSRIDPITYYTTTRSYRDCQGITLVSIFSHRLNQYKEAFDEIWGNSGMAKVSFEELTGNQI